MHSIVPTFAPGTLLDHWQGVPRYKTVMGYALDYRRGYMEGGGPEGMQRVDAILLADCLTERAPLIARLQNASVPKHM
jgi:hypothetical protein